MAVPGGEDVYATLLLTDSYLPGALVLAHSLRDANTTKKLAVLVTLDTVSVEVVTQLKAVYDYVISVDRIRNDNPANLYLMDRPDLHSAFTKINLWKQTQFRKIVYIDADVVAYRAPDELFALPQAFSAAPDIGWPDLFNTGVMVLTPDMGEFYALLAMAERGVSFDGADQGLLNMHFKNSYNRLSFSYNVTPSAHYQYIPAYRHFQSSINMVHFIGAEKPWLQGRDAHSGSGPFNEMVGRWWAVYDRHYRRQSPTSTSVPGSSGEDHSTQQTQQTPALVQYFVKGEYQPKFFYAVPVGEPARDYTGGSHGQHYEPPPPRLTPFEHPHSFEQSAPAHHHHHHHDISHSHHEHAHEHAHGEYTHDHLPSHSPHDHSHEQSHDEHHHDHHHDHHHPASESFTNVHGSHTEARPEQEHAHQQRGPSPGQERKPEPSQQPSWDAQRQPPPTDSRPEAMNFPQTHYEMSSDTAPFVAPPRYPSPPRDMWFEVPKERPAPPTARPRAIFPWETNQARASRVFADFPPEPEPAKTEESAAEASGERNDNTTESRTQAEPSTIEASTVEAKSEPETPLSQGSHGGQGPLWSSFPRSNAWDDVPEIERYVEGLQQKHRKTKSQGMKLGGVAPSDLTQEDVWQRRGSKLTDFPSEVERPSLPVTPAPIRRPKFWGGGASGIGSDDDDEGDEHLPAAEGVPAQSEWDPIAQLQKLAEQQADLLRQKLGGDGADRRNSSGFGSTGPEGREIPNRELPFGSEDVKSPTYVAQSSTVLSPKPVKPGSGTSTVRNLLQDEAESTPRTTSSNIPEPSYHGPGAAFEKDEEYMTQDRPAPPTEEELDVLDT